MPDLSLEASHLYWFDTQDTLAYQIVCLMELVEDWTLDGNDEVETAIDHFGLALDAIENFDLKQKDELIAMLAYVHTSRLLSLLIHLDSAFPGASEKLIKYAESRAHVDDVAALFLSRNVVFERMRTISRVFAPQRLALVKASLENEAHDT